MFDDSGATVGIYNHNVAVFVHCSRSNANTLIAFIAFITFIALFTLLALLALRTLFAFDTLFTLGTLRTLRQNAKIGVAYPPVAVCANVGSYTVVACRTGLTLEQSNQFFQCSGVAGFFCHFEYGLHFEFVQIIRGLFFGICLDCCFAACCRFRRSSRQITRNCKQRHACNQAKQHCNF